MSAALRRVHRLRLRGHDAETLRRLGWRLEQAFRSASLPGLPPAAEVVVRCLPLGAVPPDAGEGLLARRIDQALLRLASGAVCVDRGQATDAPVVWFSDPLQARVALLRRLLDGLAPRAWYWHSLFDTRLLQPAGIPFLLASALETPAGAAGPARLLDGVLSGPRLTPLLAALDAVTVRRLAQAQGQEVPARSRAPAERPLPAPPMSPAWRALLERATRRYGEAALVTRWLALQALLLHQPAWALRSDALQRVAPARWLASQMPLAGIDDSLPNAPSPHSGAQPGEARSGAADAGTPAGAVDVPNRPPGAKPATTGSRPSPAGDGLVATPVAGLGLLVPLLQRLGLDELLATREALLQADLPLQLLRYLACRFGMPPQDPAGALFEALAPPAPALRIVDPPAAWQALAAGTARPLLRRLAAGGEATLTALQWLAARWLWRHARLSLRGLVCRPGRVALSATHWDLVFDLAQTDLRLRRLALDCDPGWVPWLGRVVRFHYLERGQG